MVVCRALCTGVSGLYTPFDNYITLCYDSIVGACNTLQHTATHYNAMLWFYCGRLSLACRTIWFLKKEILFRFMEWQYLIMQRHDIFVFRLFCRILCNMLRLLHARKSCRHVDVTQGSFDHIMPCDSVDYSIGLFSILCRALCDIILGGLTVIS